MTKDPITPCGCESERDIVLYDVAFAITSNLKGANAMLFTIHNSLGHFGIISGLAKVPSIQILWVQSSDLLKIIHLSTCHAWTVILNTDRVWLAQWYRARLRGE